MAKKETVTFRIYRGHPGKQYWEAFELERVHSANVISCLMEIQKNPINTKGERVEPVVWEDGCLEEVCGSCSMLINGRPRQACSALIDVIIRETGSSTITLAPFTKFPLVRDLCVDRSIMFENLKKVHAWVDVDSSHDRGFGPKISQRTQELMYTLSTCMTCGCCSESCPQVNEKSGFIGPAPIAQVRLFNAHPAGKMSRRKRLLPLMEEGGISECGNAQNCSAVCPKNIPLTEAIGAMGREVTFQFFREFFSAPDREM